MENWDAPDYEGDEPLSLREATARLQAYNLAYEAVEVWGNFHGNAKIRAFPYEDDEAEAFWNALSEYARLDLEEELPCLLKEEFEFDDFKFYQWGRSGGTICPDELPNEVSGYFDITKSWHRSMPTISVNEDNIDEYAPDFVDVHADIKRFVGALKRIDSFVKSAASAEAITSWWQEERKYLIKSGVIEIEEIEEEDAEEELEAVAEAA